MHLAMHKLHEIVLILTRCKVDKQLNAMSYVVDTLSREACNFEFEFHKQHKFILNDIPDHPLSNNVLSRFGSIMMPRAYEHYINDIRNLKVYEDDIWVITYPKCGTTWAQEAVWQICNGVNVEGKGKEPIGKRFPFLEIQAVAAAAAKENSFEFINEIKRPRFIKSHLPICFLPKHLWTVKPKIVYVSRDPKDAAVSFYHHYYDLYKYCGTKEQFLDLYLRGLVEHGSYWDHVEQFHLLQDHYSNLKIITFENMKHSLELTLNELCTFMKKCLTDVQVKQLMQHLHFENMKANPAIYPIHLKEVVQKNRPGSDYMFVRRGETGSYKDEISQEYVDKFNEITKKRLQRFGGLYQSNYDFNIIV